MRCNVYQCKNCNGNRPKLSQKQLEIIKKKNLTRIKPIPYKTCNFRFAYCLKIIPKSNQFIYERNLEIQERKAIQEKEEKPHEFKKCIPQNPISPPEKSLADISKPLKTEDRSLFSICKVKGDGNCTIRAILQSVGLTQELHLAFREALAEEVNKIDFEPQLLVDNDFNNKQELVTYIRTQGNFIGIEHIMLLLEKYNVNVNIWLDNQQNGLKWIKLNEKTQEEQPRIFLHYKDYKDIYPDNPDYCEKIAHYDALISEQIDTSPAKRIIEEIILNSTLRKQELLKEAPKIECKIMLWNINSLRDFTIRSYLVKQLFENQIDIALLNETMLTEKNSVFIKGYKIFRSDGKGRKGVAILINKSLKCDSYKTIQDEEGRYIQIKLKEKDNEITISTAYVEPDSRHNPDILPEFILQSNIFGGDLNKFHSGLKITSNVYHTKNIGELVEKIDIIKKISDHPILVYKKNIPFAKNSKAKKIKIFDKIILESNRNELVKSNPLKSLYTEDKIANHRKNYSKHNFKL